MTHSYPVVRLTPEAVAQAHHTIWEPYTLANLPARQVVDNRSLYQPEVLNQGVLGSCSAFASTQARMAAFVAAGGRYTRLSELAQYYAERVLNHTVTSDSGATMAEAITVLEQEGGMPEADDAYADDYGQHYLDAPPDDWQSQYKLKPEQVLYIGNDLAAMKDALNRGLPVIVPFECFAELESAEVAETGVLPLPADPNAPIGGHMVNGILDDPVNARLGLLNQWKFTWGIKAPEALHGCFWMPYTYFERYAFDVVALLPDRDVAPKQIPVPAPAYHLEVQWQNSVVDEALGGFLWIMVSEGVEPIANAGTTVTLTWKNGEATTLTTTQTVTTSVAGLGMLEPALDHCTAVEAAVVWTDPSGVSHTASATCTVEPLPKPLPPAVAGNAGETWGLGMQIAVTPQTNQFTVGEKINITGTVLNGGTPLADYPVTLEPSTGASYPGVTNADGTVQITDWTADAPGYVNWSLHLGLSSVTVETVWSGSPIPKPAPAPKPVVRPLRGATLKELAEAPNGAYGKEHIPEQEQARKILADQRLYADFKALCDHPDTFWAESAKAAKALAALGVIG